MEAVDGWINDELINFGILRLIEKRKEFFTFPSHFYNSLYQRDRSYSYEESQRVVKLRKYRIDIFQKDVLLIPINYAAHWSLVVVIRPLLLVSFTSIVFPCMNTFVFQVRGYTDELGNHGIIIFLDSLGSYHTKDAGELREQILRYLWCEWQSYDRLQYSSKFFL